MEETKTKVEETKNPDETVGTPAESAGAETSKETEKKPKKKTGLIIGIVAVVLFVILAVVGYGAYNGYKVSDYAKKVKAIMVESNAKWSQEEINQSNLTTDEMSAKVKVIKEDSASQLKKLNGLKAPGKDKDLESKSKEYFQLANEASTNALALLDYAKALEESSNNLKGFGGNAGSVDEFVTLFTNIHNKLSATLTKLKAINPPASYKEFNQKYISALDKMDKTVVKAIGYAKSNQIGLIGNLTSEFESAMSEITQASPPSESKALEEILSESNRAKLKSYPDEIKTEADKLMKTKLSF